MIKKVMIAGTFDILHPGHIFLISEAAKLGDVYVVIATDRNREKYSGEAPIVSEEQRLDVIKNVKNVTQAVLGRSDNNTLKIVQEINPDLILLGPSQHYDIEILRKELNKNKLGHIIVKRLNKFYDKFKLDSSGKIKQKIINEYNFKNNSS